MAQELTQAAGSAGAARLVVRMVQILTKHKMPEDEVGPAIEEIVGEMSSIFGGLGAQVEEQKQRPFVEKGGR